ncbi:MAG: phosphotransferase [Anaerolineae bacterium]|jgi:aminoglycoside phosphotransferase (APT) family kinase protein|nr:phosphotransferase [Anaerolineae bacterium]
MTSDLHLAEIPITIREWLGEITRLIAPTQGCTSHLEVIEAERGIFVLKQSEEPLFARWLAQEWQVLQWLAQTALPVPHPRVFVEDAGAVWLLMDFLPGEPLTEVLLRTSVGTRAPLMFSFGATLASIHATPSPPGMLVQTATEWLDTALETGAMHLRDFRALYADPQLPDLLARLRRERPVPVPAALIHGDFTTDNVLVVEGRITGIIDWSGGAVGDPRYDLALAFDVDQDEVALAAEETVAFYAGYGRVPLSKLEQQYFLDLYELY